MPQVESETAYKSSALRRFIIPALLLIVGVQVWLIADSQLTRPMWKVVVLLAGIGVLLVPKVRQLVRAVDESLRNASAQTRAYVACIIVAVSAGYLYMSAVQQERVFAPVYTDESSYLIQARMLAEFRLWQERHELADFFDSFYVITEPVYASQYFPGTALWVAPFLKAGLPYWFAMIAATSIAVGVLYLVLCELFDATIGLLGAMMLLALPSLRMVSIMMLSQPVTLMLSAIAMLLFVRAVRKPAWSVMFGMGVASGWLAITRPADAVAILAPLWAVLIWSQRSGRERVGALLIAAVAVMPFLVLQLTLNKGVTGDYLTTPFSFYAMRDNPRTSIGFHGIDDSVQIVSDIPQKRKFYDESVRPLIRDHTPSNALRKWTLERPRQIARETLPDLLLLALVPLGLIQTWTRERFAIAMVALSFGAIYFFYTFFLAHYLVVLAPSAMVVVLGSLDRLGRARIVGWLGTGLVTVLALPQFNRHAMDMFFTPTLEPMLRAQISSLPHTPAVVLFRFAESQSLEEEAVYNVERARIDDHTVIRAHDLGARNVELFRYYGSGNQNRAIYRFDRAENRVEFLGFARDLAK
jgi:hypothetical protein